MQNEDDEHDTESAPIAGSTKSGADHAPAASAVDEPTSASTTHNETTNAKTSVARRATPLSPP